MKELRFFKIYKENPEREGSKIYLIIDNLRIELFNTRESGLLLEEILQVIKFITKKDKDRQDVILGTAIKKADDDSFIFNTRFEKLIWEDHRL